MKLDLAEFKKRFQNRSALALSVRSDGIAATLVRRDNGHCRKVNSLTVPIRADALMENPEQAGLELAAALEVAGIRERHCVICIPPEWAMSASAEMPEISPEDLRGYFELRAEREFSTQTADLRLGHCAYSTPDGKQRATLAAVPVKRMDAVEKMLEAAGRQAVSISLALGECLAGDAPALHFLARADRIDAVVTIGGGVAALRSLPGAAPGGASFDSSTFGREIRITMGRLPDSVRQQVRRVVFHGPLGIAEKAAAEVEDQLRRMGMEPESADAAFGDGSVEPAVRHLTGQPVPFEFVTVVENRWQATFQKLNTVRGREIALAALAAMVLALAVFGIRSRIVGSLQTEWEGMRLNVADIDDLQQKIRRFRPWFDGVPDNLKIFESLIAAFPEKGEVWAKSIQINDTSKIVCAGFASNQAAMMAFLDRLRGRPGVTALQVQQLRGDNPVQFSVTFKWEPMHEG